MSVRVLPEELINKIAAGEVVDRPASIVRELVDNAVDAGATQILISLEQGGLTMIRVTDDGCGMVQDDAVLAFERHATSKIVNSGDLDAIATLGFRGEALAAIAAVSKIRLKTRVKDAQSATEVRVSGGTLKDVYPCAGKVGTDIEIKSLFFNTPARKKFLKSANAELGRIKDFITRYALPHFGITFRVENDGRDVLTLPKVESLRARAIKLIRGNTVAVDGELGPVVVSGLVAHPSLAESKSRSLITLVNNRVVYDPLIVKAVREGFMSTVKEREYPIGVVHVQLPNSLVDVNVHPQKNEVRFVAPRDVFLAVQYSVSEAVKGFQQPTVMTQPVTEEISSPAISSQAPPQMSFTQSVVPAPTLASTFATEPKEVIEERQGIRFCELRYLGQALNCYLLCEHGETLVIVDMHAAHERYNYNLIRNQFKGKKVESQLLLTPQVVGLTAEEAANCLGMVDVLKNFGFDIEAFGDDSVVIREVPTLLADHDVESLIKEFAGSSIQIEGEELLDRELDHIAARLACHASIRSGYEIKKEEVHALFDSLDQTEFAAACPHGRPVVVSFDRPDVERWFGRIR